MVEKEEDRPFQWAVFGVLVVVEFVLLGRLLFGGSDAGLLIGAITVISALLVVTIRLFDLGSLSFGKEGLRAELKVVEERVEQVDRRITELFLLTMSREMFANLKKLASRHFGPYEMGTGLERELRHLRDIGYVEFRVIGPIPKNGGDLSDFVKVTPAGERFVVLRQELDSEQKGATGLATTLT